MSKKFFVLFALLAVVLLALSACGGSATPAPAESGAADPVAGKAIFEQTIVGSNAGCVTCHSLEAGTVLVGPSLAGIATTAATRESGKTAEAYIRESILTPDAYVVEGFQAGLMLPGWDTALSEKELNNLVAYLLTLK